MDRGPLLAAGMEESNQFWWITVRAPQSDSVTWNFAAPVKLYNGDDKGFAALRLTPLGWFFISGYDSGTIGYLWCRALSAAGVGTWTSANMAGSAVVSYQNPAFCFDVQRNLLVTAIQAWGTTSSLAWYVVTGTLGSNGETWTFGTVRAIVVDGVAAEGPPTFADLEYSPEGGFTFLFVNTSGSRVLARCRALESNGTGAGRRRRGVPRAWCLVPAGFLFVKRVGAHSL